MSGDAVGQFFDALTGEYTEAIERCFPRYREMLWAVLDYLPRGEQMRSTLELGAGTGNLTVLLAEAYPSAAISFVDIAEDSLAVCKTRLRDESRFNGIATDMRSLDFPAESFDLIASSIAIHHLQSEEKVALFGRIRRWLRPGGVFVYADQFRGASDDVYARHISNWRDASIAAGGTLDEFDMWMEHQRSHDFHDTLTDQMSWLVEAGFGTVDCVWRYLLWSVVQARC